MDRVLFQFGSPRSILAYIRWGFMDRSIDCVVNAHKHTRSHARTHIYLLFNSLDRIECGPNLECVVFKRISVIDILSLSLVKATARAESVVYFAQFPL